jgi:hypothetical protein
MYCCHVDTSMADILHSSGMTMGDLGGVLAEGILRGWWGRMGRV